MLIRVVGENPEANEEEEIGLFRFVEMDYNGDLSLWAGEDEMPVVTHILARVEDADQIAVLVVAGPGKGQPTRHFHRIAILHGRV